MPLTTLIPERTIDSLFAFEILSAAPTAHIYSPANNAGPGTPDHYLNGARRRFVFELKTIYRNPVTNPNDWYVRVPARQLATYVSTGNGNFVYVLPAKPPNVAVPWDRTCAIDPDANGYCKACSNPTRNAGPVYERRWAGTSRPTSTTTNDFQRLQPWFNHWAWCVTVTDLQHHVSSKGLSGQNLDLGAADSSLAAIPGAFRFCHLLAKIRADASSPSDGGDGNQDGGEGTQSGGGGTQDGAGGAASPANSTGDPGTPSDEVFDGIATNSGEVTVSEDDNQVWVGY